MSTQNSINQLFNNNSKAFGDTIEQQYQTGSYKRGEVFLKKVTNYVLASDAKILDYGCGTGRISMMLGDQGYQVTGVDPAVEHIKIAQSLNHLPLVNFQVLTEDTIITSIRFDAVVSSSVFEFVPDAQQYISAIDNVLKPGGVLIISFPNLFSLWRVYAKLRYGKKYNHFKFQKHLLSKSEIKKLLMKNNFRKLEGPQYYESVFDHKGLGFLNASRFFGTLGVWVFQKK
ncbi:MAG: class I SAM-dependent methyltransferase [Cytophagaceae bacterium]|nr:class I SAM-dependent methyltransferase [Cytophagaceae bacterium]